MSNLFNPDDYYHLLNSHWRRNNKDGYEYKLIGIMFATDDWYWVMQRGERFDEHVQFLSCVGCIEDFGYERLDLYPHTAVAVEEHSNPDSDLIFKENNK